MLAVAWRNSGSGSDIVTLTEWPVAGRIVGWGKKAIAVARRVATLESRVKLLEGRLEKQPPDACPGCGERAMRRTEAGHVSPSSASSVRRDLWTCQKCAQEEYRIIKF